MTSALAEADTKVIPVIPAVAATPATVTAPAAQAAPVASAQPVVTPVVAGAATDEKSATITLSALLKDADKPAEAVADPAKPAEAAAAKTETAAWELKAPEGVTLTADELKATESFAKENGLTQAQAEKILARDVGARSAAATAQKAEVDGVASTWLKQAQEHPEIGGAKLQPALQNAKRALMAWATPDERKIIMDSPFANNPLFLAILNRAAATLPVEDVNLSGAAAKAAAPKNPAQIMYPHLYPH